MTWSDYFNVRTPIRRIPYALTGLVLGSVKYFIEATVVALLTGQFFTPVEFVNPWLSSKAAFLIEHEFGTYLGIGWIAFTLPFVWVAISMSVRRAADVGLTPWCGMLILVPLVNLAVMLVLALLPSRWLSSIDRAEDQQRSKELASAFRPPADEPILDVTSRAGAANPVADLAWAILVGCGTQVFVGLISVWVFQQYGFILFFATPVIAGATSGYVFNRRYQYGIGRNFGMILLMNVLSFVAMLSVGLDGAICLLMAFPLLAPLSWIGALVGRVIATAGLRGPGREDRGLIGIIILLPITLCLEPLDDHQSVHRVTTVIEVDAPIERVWQQVISFPEITDPPAWYFRLGIAAPIRARIEGSGVGAHRYCEFTTGAFVEPITDWNPPTQLGFDVASQPQPMTEWTPFAGLHPPHLEDGFVSERGEFRLAVMGDGRTRLSGTTWYRIDVRPRLYWKVWADTVIGQIHLRVLEHIRRQAERPQR